MRRALVAANWKMNGNLNTVAELLTSFKANISTEGVDVAVFAPAVFLPKTEELLSGSGIAWGG